MSFKCNIGLHSWDGCTCTECGKTRDTGHEIAADCGKCSRCGEVFKDDQHDWSADCDKCAKCGKTRDNQHNWLKDCEKCSKCGKVRSNVHLLADGVCKVCGHGTFHDDSDGSIHKVIKIGDQVIMAENFSKKTSRGNFWEYDDKDGNKRNITEILCDNMVMLGGNKQAGPAPVVTSTQGEFGTQPINQNDPVQDNNMNYSNEGSNDDLPF